MNPSFHSMLLVHWAWFPKFFSQNPLGPLKIKNGSKMDSMHISKAWPKPAWMRDYKIYFSIVSWPTGAWEPSHHWTSEKLSAIMSRIVSLHLTMHHKNRIMIVSQILEYARNGWTTRIQISHKISLSYIPLQEYLAILVDNGLNSVTFSGTITGYD